MPVKLPTAVVMLALMIVSTAGQTHSPPKGAKIFFIGLEDGATVRNPIKLEFGIEGFGITPAGTTGPVRHTAGHHHLLLNVEKLPDMDEPIPMDRNHVHFNKGETAATLNLPPGKHSLQLLLGDEDHEPQDPPLLSQKITITVKP